MPPNGPDEWRARIGHWENRKLRWYQAHCGSRPRVPLYLHLEQVISEAPLVCVLLCLCLARKVSTSVFDTGNGIPSSPGKLGRCSACVRRGSVWAMPLLSIILALSLLLVIAGDVETNPGPITSEKLNPLKFIMKITHDQNVISFSSDKLLAQVDDSELCKFTVISFSRLLAGMHLQYVYRHTSTIPGLNHLTKQKLKMYCRKLYEGDVTNVCCIQQAHTGL